MKLRGLQHVSSPFPQGRQADVRRFYGEVLGLTEVEVPRTLDGSRLVWYSVGDGLELHFYTGDPAPGSTRHFCLDVEDLEETPAGRGRAGAIRRHADPQPAAVLLPRPVRQPGRVHHHPGRLPRLTVR